ncbi:MAG: CBM13, partial [uncultured Gemmatimonadaceae bacterium]
GRHWDRARRGARRGRGHRDHRRPVGEHDRHRRPPRGSDRRHRRAPRDHRRAGGGAAHRDPARRQRPTADGPHGGVVEQQRGGGDRRPHHRDRGGAQRRHGGDHGLGGRRGRHEHDHHHRAAAQRPHRRPGRHGRLRVRVHQPDLRLHRPQHRHRRRAAHDLALGVRRRHHVAVPQLRRGVLGGGHLHGEAHHHRRPRRVGHRVQDGDGREQLPGGAAREPRHRGVPERGRERRGGPARLAAHHPPLRRPQRPALLAPHRRRRGPAPAHALHQPLRRAAVGRGRPAAHLAVARRAVPAVDVRAHRRAAALRHRPLHHRHRQPVGGGGELQCAGQSAVGRAPV